MAEPSRKFDAETFTSLLLQLKPLNLEGRTTVEAENEPGGVGRPPSARPRRKRTYSREMVLRLIERIKQQ